MQILIIGSGSSDRADILAALAKIKPEFSAMLIEHDHSEETIRAIVEACNPNATGIMKENIKELVALPILEDVYIPTEKPKYKCNGQLKRR